LGKIFLAMQKNLINLLLTLLLVTCATTVQAQNKKAKSKLENRAQFFTKEITDYLTKIDSPQTKQLYDINLQVSIAFDSLKTLNLPSEEYRPAAASIYKNRDAAVKLVLNKFQYDEYLMLQAEKKQAYREKKKKEEEAQEKEQDSTKPSK
jgi:hypothetical protein